MGVLSLGNSRDPSVKGLKARAVSSVRGCTQGAKGPCLSDCPVRTIVAGTCALEDGIVHLVFGHRRK